MELTWLIPRFYDGGKSYVKYCIAIKLAIVQDDKENPIQTPNPQNKPNQGLKTNCTHLGIIHIIQSINSHGLAPQRLAGSVGWTSLLFLLMLLFLHTRPEGVALALGVEVVLGGWVVFGG